MAEGEECNILALPRRRYGLERVPRGMCLGVAMSQGRRHPQEAGALCVSCMCMLKDIARPGAGRKLPPFKRACLWLVWLALQSLCSRVFLPPLLAARLGLI